MALWSIAEASEAIEVHPNTLRNWVRSGLIHAYRIHAGGKIYVKDKEIMRIAEKMKRNPRLLVSNEFTEDIDGED